MGCLRDEGRPMSGPVLRWMRRGVALVSVVVLAWVLWDGFNSGARLPEGSAWRLTVAIPVSTLGLLCAATSWSELAGVGWKKALSAFGTSLPLRHLPLGGLGQIAGMAGLSVTGGGAKRRVAQAGPVFLLATAAGASFVSIPLLWDSETAPWIRVGAGIAVAGSMLLVARGRWVLRLVSRWWRLAEGSEELPIERAIFWSSLAAVGAGGSFAILFADSSSFVRAISGFSAAWLGGFLFVIAPAGLGAREAVLVALWPSVNTAELVAVALLHRLSTLLAEGLILIVALLLSRSSDEPSLERM
jgi:hypothetical protein